MSDEKDFTMSYGLPIRHYPTAISLRDHFAGLAMQGYIQSTDFSSLVRVGITDEEFDKMIAKSAYDTADAMLAEKEKAK